MVRKQIIACFLLFGLLGFGPAAIAQEVKLTISGEETWVGMPLSLAIEITNASSYDFPEDFEIDGCDIQSTEPSRSSQLTIIMGRRSQRTSIIKQYLITPRRPGQFTIPALAISVDGNVKRTAPLSFSAQQSETGDLMFVEIEGNQDRVFVGQPLDLTLKIWLKPYVDQQRKLKLSESQMWQLISSQSQWGKFLDRLQELANNNRRPSGKTVQRTNQQGESQEYYLYEIDATVYPTRPGSIDASDVQIVARYPTKLDRQRDPFESMLADDPLMKQMLNDRFFGSPFGRQLSVADWRPITAEAEVDSTEVIPIPAVGRPDDYRGAVGQYRIVTEAEPREVAAGDPITFRIGIQGTGPMELVQAPPLNSLPILTPDFKVTDQSLAGFVQGDTKVFVTSLRPTREGIEQIPAIPFSFFNPDSESFETVYSDPISIKVAPAETLSLDSIAGQASSNPANSPAQADFSNQYSMDLLSPGEPTNDRWKLFAAAPAIAWTLLMLTGLKPGFKLSQFRSPETTADRSLATAGSTSELAAAMIKYLQRKTKSNFESDAHAIGELRSRGLGAVANQVESWLNQLRAAENTPNGKDLELADARQQGQELVEQLHQQFASLRHRPRAAARTAFFKAGSLLFFLLALSAPAMAQSDSSNAAELTMPQRHAIFEDANRLYRLGTERSADPAEAKPLFAQAAQKYRLLVQPDSPNDQLLVNLGNAEFQSGRLAAAIASYRKALRIDPANQQARLNLKQARQRLDLPATGAGGSAGGENSSSSLLASSTQSIQAASRLVGSMVLQQLGRGGTQWTLVIASIVFWSLLALPRLGFSRYLALGSLVPGFILLVAGLALWFDHQTCQQSIGIATANQLELKSGDGVEFETSATLEGTLGVDVEIIDRRGQWLQIRRDQQQGWVPQSVIEPI